ncbi:MAG: RidA family protein [Rhodospirillales bacterium]|jgi:enamine deaminase RidA (YjgF/YER057c/UK114 family)
MSDIVRIETGPRSSQAVIYNGVVHLAGQVARGSENASVAAQTHEILRNIDRLLVAAGSDKSRLITSTIFLADFRRFDEMNDVWMAWVVPGSTPARAVVEAKLVTPGFGVEIFVQAAVST